MWPKKSPDDFTDQVVLITGGSRGIGYVTAQMFLEQGARVAICSQNPDKLAAATEQLGPAVLAEVVDLRDRGQIDRFVNAVQERFGRIDILVNNAGLAYSGEFMDQTPASIDAIIDVNVKGLLHITHAVLPHMRARQHGVIINISSGAGLTGYGGLTTYCASKFGVVGFTESLDQETSRYGIHVYGLCPGRVATDMQVEVSGSKIGMEPDKVAAKILQVAGRKPPIAGGQNLEVR